MKDRQFVLVEGKDDMHVISHLCGASMIPPALKFEPFESVDELISAIRWTSSAFGHLDYA